MLIYCLLLKYNVGILNLNQRYGKTKLKKEFRVIFSMY